METHLKKSIRGTGFFIFLLKSLENTGSDGILKSLHYDKPTIRFLSFILNIRDGLLLHLGKMLIKWHKKKPITPDEKS